MWRIVDNRNEFIYTTDYETEEEANKQLKGIVELKEKLGFSYDYDVAIIKPNGLVKKYSDYINLYELIYEYFDFKNKFDSFKAYFERCRGLDEYGYCLSNFSMEDMEEEAKWVIEKENEIKNRN